MPRPTGPTQPNDLKMTSVRISQGGWRQMQAAAHAIGMYGSEALNEAIDKWNAEHPPPKGAAEPPKRGRRPPTPPSASPQPTQPSPTKSRRRHRANATPQ